MTLSDATVIPLTRSHGCSACGRDTDRPRACGDCAARATDSRGRALTFIGPDARLALVDGTPGEDAVDVNAFATCFIDKQPFHIETTDGTAVLVPLAAWLDRPAAL